MDALRVAITAFTLLVAAPAQATSVSQWRPFVAEASARFGIPVTWIERVIRAESGGIAMLDGSPITSRAGAMGLMQLMPRTWAELRSQLQLGDDPYDPRDNIIAGTAYLRLMYDRFGYPGLFAAYNAGPGRYAAYLEGRARLPGETVTYLAVTSGPDVRELAPPDATTVPLFFIRRDDRSNSVEKGGEGRSALFVLRN